MLALDMGIGFPAETGEELGHKFRPSGARQAERFGGNLDDRESHAGTL